MKYLLLLSLLFVGGGQIEYSRAWTHYTGAGIVVGINDSGKVNFAHQDLEHIEHVNYASYSVNTHATGIAGIIGGKNKFGEGRYKGFAPDVKMVVSNSNSGWYSSGRSWNEHNVSITNNSYTSGSLSGGVGGQKVDIQMYQIDSLSIDFDSILHITAAGNNPREAWSGIQSAKNILNVGTLDSDWSRYGTSPRVYTFDGRYYLHLLAMGINVTAPSAAGVDKYSRTGGSSQAAAAVTGCAALLSEAMGGAQPNALLKNLLCNTARDIAPVGYDKWSGFGAVDLRAALKAKDNYFYSWIKEGETKEYNLPMEIDKGYRVMLTWNDSPAKRNETCGILKNNLDLKVNGYLPTIPYPEPNDDKRNGIRGYDEKNNIEQVRTSRTDTLSIVITAPKMQEDSIKYFVTWY